jgi:hypothetical protein
MSQAPDEKPLITATPTGLGRLLADAASPKARAAPPLDLWNPPFCGDMDLTIDAQGEWFHEGTRMTRQSLVDLFATVLWREDDRYFLKTPVEKIGITVEDVPLLVIQLDQVTDDDGVVWLEAKTKTGDTLRIDAEHGVFMRAFAGEVRPYIQVRRNLEALVHRNAFYHLLAMGEWLDTAHGSALRVCSGGHSFVLDAVG